MLIRTSFRLRRVSGLLAILLTLPAMQSRAEEPGRGKTATLEVSYLKFIVNHHYSALRITELAAGSDTTRDPALSPEEGTSPSPGFSPSPPKAGLADIKSMARTGNRMQREEILTALKFLHDWYGITSQPQLTQDGKALIALLQRAQPGSQFDRAFLTGFSAHHYSALTSSLQCLVGRELEHDELRRYCSGIVNAQLNEIDEMRHLLCSEFAVCDWQPQGGARKPGDH